MCYCVVHFDPVVQVISLMLMGYRVQVLVTAVFLYLVAAVVSQKLGKYHTILSMHKYSFIYILELLNFLKRTN